MSKTISCEIRLASRPGGLPTADNFKLGQLELEPLQDQETVVEGIDQAVGALIGLFSGGNVGRMVVKLA